jgi:hypothetical protein
VAAEADVRLGQTARPQVQVKRLRVRQPVHPQHVLWSHGRVFIVAHFAPLPVEASFCLDHSDNE